MTSSAPTDVTGDVTSMWPMGHESAVPLPGPGVTWQAVAERSVGDAEQTAAAAELAPSS